MLYRCTKCLGGYRGFLLVCPGCGSWDSFSRELAEGEPSAGAVALADIAPEPDIRRPTNIPAIDAILGGGFMPGSSLLLVGSPGAGKSTLALQILKKMNVRSLYVTGEESVGQLKMRAERLRIRSKRLFLLFETNVRNVRREMAGSGAEICVVDSIQTMFSETSDALPGSPAQLRKCSQLLRATAKEEKTVLFLVGQVTKDRKSAGPKMIEHAMDVVLALEAEEVGSPSRVLHALKNRYGSIASECRLRMGKAGLRLARPGR